MKKLTKKELKQQFKPWITYGIQNSIQIREKLYKKFINSKNVDIKEEYNKAYEELRNRIVTLSRQSKKMYYQIFFTECSNDAKKTWRGIINIQSSISFNLSSLMVKYEMISDPIKIANEFNQYFSTIGSQLQGRIYHYRQDFSKYQKSSKEYSL